MSYGISIGILVALILGAILLFVSIGVVSRLLRYRLYRRKFPDLLMDTVFSTGLWDIGRSEDRILLMNWGKHHSIKLSDILGYRQKLTRFVRMPSGRGNGVDEYQGNIDLETKDWGSFMIYDGDGDTSDDVAECLQSLGIRCLDRSLDTISSF